METLSNTEGYIGTDEPRHHNPQFGDRWVKLTGDSDATERYIYSGDRWLKIPEELAEWNRLADGHKVKFLDSL